jgi:(R,R)-butanediol dehydrogenase/meso-butanediol dehydrogenase/diacetyl reductase
VTVAGLPAFMRAAVFHGAHDVRLERVPLPARHEGEALIQVLRSGICGTDATEWRTGPLSFPIGLIIGHEFVGRVVESVPGSAIRVGSVVVSGAGVSCGHCARCIEGRTNLCATYHTLGLSVDGGLAEFVSCPESVLVPVPYGVTVDAAGLAQPLAVGMHAARRSRARDGDRVVIIGAGAIGSFIVAALESMVDVDLTVVDMPGPRLDRARRLGADRILPAGITAVADVLDALGGGADVVVEASGATGQLDTAVAMTRQGGTVVQVGLPPATQEVDIHTLVLNEISVITTVAHICSQDLGPALALLATSTLVAEMLDSVRPLDEISEQLELLASGKLDGKVLFDPAR